MRRGASRGPAASRAGQPTAAGWYPDPEDPASVRHWDGTGWGAERRPRPGWATPAPATAGPLVAQRGRGGGLLFACPAAALALVVAVAGATLGGGPDLPPRTVFDEQFVQRADAVCEELLPGIRADRPEPGPEGGRTPLQLAPRVERAADGLDGLVARLDALVVLPDDQTDVDGWLADWRTYIALGRDYAATLRRGDASTGAEVGAETGRVGQRIFLFARANAMASCTP
jgi:hypothetical protein